MGEFSEEIWEAITDRVSVVFNFGVAQKEWLKKNTIAKLITATPYLAECRKKEVIAFSHLSLYIIAQSEVGKNVFFHKEEDDLDIYSRLQPISHFVEGNKITIQRSIDLLTLCMITNYKEDAENDLKLGKYNPVALGKWDYDSLSKKLIENISANDDQDMDSIFSINDALRGYWK